MKLIKYIKSLYVNYKRNRKYKQRIKELKKRDPYNYKNF